jgi:glutamine---fructose-6-phosphate transaminase (isomerizing)
MCGIVGYVGESEATPIIIDGLRRLEYRGYDSAGVALLQKDCVQVRRSAGKLSNLEKVLSCDPTVGCVGIGHTRWATHGEPSEINAHPHTDCKEEIVVIHNGIVENYLALKADLQREGHVFKSQTDSEVIVHLIEKHMDNGAAHLEDAVRTTLGEIKGAHAIVAATCREPGKLVAARLGNAGGVVVGMGQNEMFVASDMPAILSHTREMSFLESEEVAVLTKDSVKYFTLAGEPISKTVQVMPWDSIAAAKGGYKHFMQKEIYEQSRSVTDTIRGRVNVETSEIYLDDVPFSAEEVSRFKRVVIVACGTSWYSGQAGKFMIERLARLPVEVEYGSEFRYRDPLVDENTLVVSITQSGETVDTLAALDESRRKGAKLLSIVNVVGSQAARVSDAVIYMQAGPEIGVASTKAFTSSLIDQYLLALYLGLQRGTLSQEDAKPLIKDLLEIPKVVGDVLEDDHIYEHLAAKYHNAQDFLYLGRGISYPVALEGAHKLKEISYIHAEGCPAGEMKHGINALIDQNLPVVAIAVKDHVYEKMISNIEQVKARDGMVIGLATAGDNDIAAKVDDVIYLPPLPELLSPVVTVIPLQLLAYHIAVRRGCDVDQPRNLAKSVTVE